MISRVNNKIKHESQFEIRVFSSTLFLLDGEVYLAHNYFIYLIG